MDIFEYEEVRGTSRTLQQDEEEQAVSTAQQWLEEPLIVWNKAWKARGPLSTKLLVVATCTASCAVLRAATASKQGHLVASLVSPNISLEGIRVDGALSDPTCLVHSVGPSGHVLLATCQAGVPPEQAAAWARGMLGTFPADRTLVLGTMPAERFCGEGDASQECLLFLLRTATAQAQGPPPPRGLPLLPTGNLVGGLPAALLSHCQVQGRAAELVVAVQMVPSLAPEFVAPLAQAAQALARPHLDGAVAGAQQSGGAAAGPGMDVDLLGLDLVSGAAAARREVSALVDTPHARTAVVFV